MTLRGILEAAVASLPVGLPAPALTGGGLHGAWASAVWDEDGAEVTVQWVRGILSSDGSWESRDPPTLRAVAHVLGEVARLLEEGA